MRSGNPVLKDSTFQQPLVTGDRMTLAGTVNKTAMLLAMTLITAAYTWGRFMESRDASTISGLLLLGAVGGLVVAMITVFKKTAAPYTAPIYALLAGTRARRHLSDARSAVSRHRDPGGRAHVRHALFACSPPIAAGSSR